MRRLLSAGIAGVLLGAPGCPADPTEPPPPLLLVISIDTLRADRLGFYGQPRPVSPHLDALAAESVVFDAAQTTAPWTLPAHASLLSGRYPSRHSLTAHGRALREEIPTLASILRTAGWQTASVVNSRHLSERNGIQRGFEKRFLKRDSAQQVGATRELVDQALEWIEEERERPLFLFLHTFDAHSDYRSTRPHRGRFEEPYEGHAAGYTKQLLAHRQGAFAFDAEGRQHLLDLYDQGVHQVDAELGRLFEALRRKRRLDSSLVVVTSDHGEEFLDHGDVLHGRNHFEPVVRVPLLIRPPGLAVSRRIDTPVSLVDVVPTVLSQLEIAPLDPGELDGLDLRPLWESPGTDWPQRGLFIEGDHNRSPAGMLASVRRGAFKLHLDRATDRVRLYDLAADPGETRDLAIPRAEIARSLRKELDDFLEKAPQPAEKLPISDEDRSHLESLGYVVPPAPGQSRSEKNQVLPHQHRERP